MKGEVGIDPINRTTRKFLLGKSKLALAEQEAETSSSLCALPNTTVAENMRVGTVL